MARNLEAQDEVLEALRRATEEGLPFKRKRGRPPGKKVKLNPTEYTTKRRRQRKRCTTRKDSTSPRAAMMREKYKDPAFRAQMEEKVWGPRRRGEIGAARHRIPDGYTKETAAVMFAEAEKKAEIVLAKLKEKEVVDFSNLPTSDADRAELALKECLTIGLSDSATQYRISALGQVLKYCRVAPERKSRITVESAEQWLAEAIADDADQSDEPSETP